MKRKRSVPRGDDRGAVFGSAIRGGGTIMEKTGGDRKAKVLRYIARGISTTFTGIIVLFAVGEGLGSTAPKKLFQWDYEHLKMTAYVFLIVAGTGLGWWRDKLGGIILSLAGVVMSLLVFIEMNNRDFWVAGIFGLPYMLSGLLFLLSWKRSGRDQS